MTAEPRPDSPESLEQPTSLERLHALLERDRDMLREIAAEHAPLTFDEAISMTSQEKQREQLGKIRDLVGWPTKDRELDTSLWLDDDDDLARELVLGRNPALDRINNFVHYAYIPIWDGVDSHVPASDHYLEREHAMKPYRMRFAAMFPELSDALEVVMQELHDDRHTRDSLLTEYIHAEGEDQHLTTIAALRIAHCIQQRLMCAEDSILAADMADPDHSGRSPIADSADELFT